MLPMRDGVRLATVVIRPEGRGPAYPTLMIRTPYADDLVRPAERDRTSRCSRTTTSIVMQNERGTEWSEGEFGFLTKTTDDAHGHAGLDRGAGLVERPGRPARLLLDGGEPAQARRHRAPGAARLRADELGRRDRLHSGHRGLRRAASTAAGCRCSRPGRCGTRRSASGIRPKLPPRPTATSWRGLPPVLGQRARLPAARVRRPRWPSRRWRRRAARCCGGWARRSPGSSSTWRRPDRAGLGHRRPDRRQPHRRDAVAQHQRLDGHRRVRDGQAVRVPAAPPGAVPDHGADLALQDDDRPRRTPSSATGRSATPGSPTTRSSSPGSTGWLRGRGRRLEADAEGAGVPDGRRDLAHRRDLAAAGDRGRATLYLTSGGSANTLWGDGALVPTRPDRPGPTTSSPTRTTRCRRSAATWRSDTPVCADQRSVECRADVLVYSTPVLTEAITIAGDVSAELYVSADVPDTDVFVKLVDVYPDGDGLQPGRDLPAAALPGQPGQPVAPGAGRDLPDRGARDHHGQLLPGRAPDPDRGRGLQLPARRPELAYRRRNEHETDGPSRTSRCTTAPSTRPASSTAPTPGRSRLKTADSAF